MRIIGSSWSRPLRRRAHVAALLAGAAVAAAAAAPRAGAEEIQVIKSGKYYGAVTAYRVDDRDYLAAKESARIYGGQVYWYAVRGEVRLSLRGRQMRFTADAETADVQGKTVALPRPMIIRASQAFIPIDFFTGRDFSDLAGVDTKFNPITRLLLVDQRSNVGPLRWFTYADHTRVVLEISEDLRYQTAKRGRDGFEISIPNGSIDWSEKIDINDGVLEFIHLDQDAKHARLTLKMQESCDGMKVREFQAPRRIVIDAARAEGPSRRVSTEAPEPAETVRGDETAPPESAVAAEAPQPAEAAPLPPEPAELPAPPPAPSSGSKDRYRVVIDAGHGGKDGGAVGRRGTLEKDINLSAAHELASLLRQEGMFDVMLTREKDEFLRLGERSSRANKFGADLFISIHCNAHSNRAESGFEIYFLSERASDPEAERLAEFENSVLALEGDGEIEDKAASVLYALTKTEYINDAAELAGRMARALGMRVDLRNRGVRQAAFYVLRGANASAVLVEMGFVTHARDEAKLQSEKYRRKIIEGLYAGVIDHARRRLRRPEGGK